MRVMVLGMREGARQWGRDHGESFRGEIRSLAEIRLYLSVKLGRFQSKEQVLGIAERHLPVLERFDPALYQELLGIAEGAAMSPAHIVVLNHYTDLRDIDPKDLPGDPGGCSVVWARTPAGPVLAQTWDMHATAIPYMLMLHVPEHEGRPEMWLLSLTGCLGMAGMNNRGVGVAINNLRSTDARIGVVWPALVRRALAEQSAQAARDVILSSPVGSGHHYMAADASSAYGIETSGQRRAVVFAAGDEDDSYVHTNHCLDPGIAEVTDVPADGTSKERYDWLAHSIRHRPIANVHDAWERLGSTEGYPRSVCTNMATPENPHGAATCGAIAMDLGARRVWAQSGLIHNVGALCFDFAEKPDVP